MVLFTSTDDEDTLQWIRGYCSYYRIRIDYINESPIMKTKKPYYNILLDDRAGLQEAANTLNSVLNLIEINRDELNQSDKIENPQGFPILSLPSLMVSLI